MSSTQTIVRDLRALGLSQTEIARRTGIPQSRLSRWEKGLVPAGADDALALMRLRAELVPAEGVEPSVEKAVRDVA